MCAGGNKTHLATVNSRWPARTSPGKVEFPS